MTYYEIGQITGKGIRYTFITDSLVELLKKWIKESYSARKCYFMEIRLMDQNGIYHSITILQPEDIDFKMLKELL